MSMHSYFSFNEHWKCNKIKEWLWHFHPEHFQFGWIATAEMLKSGPLTLSSASQYHWIWANNKQQRNIVWLLHHWLRDKYSFDSHVCLEFYIQDWPEAPQLHTKVWPALLRMSSKLMFLSHGSVRASFYVCWGSLWCIAVLFLTGSRTFADMTHVLALICGEFTLQTQPLVMVVKEHSFNFLVLSLRDLWLLWMLLYRIQTGHRRGVLLL